MAVIKMSLDQLFNLYRTALSFFVFFFSKFYKVFQTQTKLYQPKKAKGKKNEHGRRKMTGSVGGQVHKYNCKKKNNNK